MTHEELVKLINAFGNYRYAKNDLKDILSPIAFFLGYENLSNVDITIEKVTFSAEKGEDQRDFEFPTKLLAHRDEEIIKYLQRGKKGSELKEMWKRHRNEVKALQKGCRHENLKIYHDSSVVGRGYDVPAVWVICKNCGKKKIMFIDGSEANVNIEMTLDRQKGINNQHLDCSVFHEWEIE